MIRPTSDASEPDIPEVSAGSWPQQRDALSERYPDAGEGILFCVSKLQEDPSLTIPDFREEAAALGIRLGGRSLHSARKLLGLAQASAPKRVKAATEKSDTRAPDGNNQGFEGRLIRVVADIQSQATEDSRRLREAIRKALDVVEAALKPR